MKKIEKSQRIDYIKSKHNRPTKPHAPNEEFGFILWKAELNKELTSFWKSMILGEDEEE